MPLTRDFWSLSCYEFPARGWPVGLNEITERQSEHVGELPLNWAKAGWAPVEIRGYRAAVEERGYPVALGINPGTLRAELVGCEAG
jgi:hypothetical protein